jgi:hypothetical protein
MKMIDKIKEYIGEAQALNKTSGTRSFQIKFLGTKDLKEFLPNLKMS